MTKIAYKLFRVRKDGTLGPLFINQSQRIPVGEWLPSGDHPTKGYLRRPGWHCTAAPDAPQLRRRDGSYAPGRAWYRVAIRDWAAHKRPASQGGLWYLAGQMKVLGPA